MPTMFDKPEDFRSGDRSISAGALNDLVRGMMRQVTGGRDVDVAYYGDRVVITDSGARPGVVNKSILRFIVLEVKDDYLVCHPFLQPYLEEGDAGYNSSYVKKPWRQYVAGAILPEVESTQLDGGATSHKAISDIRVLIAKPYELQVTPWRHTVGFYERTPDWAGRESPDGVKRYYIYSSQGSRGAFVYDSVNSQGQFVNVGAKSNEIDFQSVSPPYTVGSLIDARPMLTGLYDNVDSDGNYPPIMWEDVNQAGRSWQSERRQLYARVRERTYPDAVHGYEYEVSPQLLPDISNRSRKILFGVGTAYSAHLTYPLYYLDPGYGLGADEIDPLDPYVHPWRSSGIFSVSHEVDGDSFGDVWVTNPANVQVTPDGLVNVDNEGEAYAWLVCLGAYNHCLPRRIYPVWKGPKVQGHQVYYTMGERKEQHFMVTTPGYGSFKGVPVVRGGPNPISGIAGDWNVDDLAAFAGGWPDGTPISTMEATVESPDRQSQDYYGAGEVYIVEPYEDYHDSRRFFVKSPAAKTGPYRGTFQRFDPGIVGDVKSDGTYLYICYSRGIWKRIDMAAFTATTGYTWQTTW